MNKKIKNLINISRVTKYSQEELFLLKNYYWDTDNPERHRKLVQRALIDNRRLKSEKKTKAKPIENFSKAYIKFPFKNIEAVKTAINSVIEIENTDLLNLCKNLGLSTNYRYIHRTVSSGANIPYYFIAELSKRYDITPEVLCDDETMIEHFNRLAKKHKTTLFNVRSYLTGKSRYVLNSSRITVEEVLMLEKYFDKLN